MTLGEWRGGVSPPRSHRTGREPLSSSGSQYPAALHAEVASAQRRILAPDDPGEPLPRWAFGLGRKRLYLRRAHFLRWKSIRVLSYSADL